MNLSISVISIPILEISRKIQDEQIVRLNQLKQERNNKEVALKLQLITDACKTDKNLLPLIIDAATSYATPAINAIFETSEIFEITIISYPHSA